MSDTATAASAFVPLFVCGLVFAVLAFQAVLWVVILRTIRRRAAQRTAELQQSLAQLAASGELTVLPPTVCRLRVGHVTRTNVWVALTTGRVLWHRGERHELLLRDVLSFREAPNYNGSYRSGVRWLIFTGSAQEVGFGFPSWNHARWAQEAKRLLGRA
jgi:hypothetical protein